MVKYSNILLLAGALFLLLSLSCSAKEQLLLTVASDANPGEIAFYHTITDQTGNIIGIKRSCFYSALNKYKTNTFMRTKEGSKKGTELQEIVLNKNNDLEVVILQFIDFAPEKGGVLRLKYLSDATSLFSDKYKYFDMNLGLHENQWKIFFKNEQVQEVSLVKTLFFKKRISSLFGIIGIREVVINNSMPNLLAHAI